MRVRTLAVLILALGLMAGGSALAKQRAFPGYWPTPVPTVTATSTPPSGKALITDMYAAMNTLGSVHIEYSGQFEEPGVERGTVTGSEDVSLRTHREHTVFRTQVTSLSSRAVDYSSVEENIAVKHTQATRGEPGEIPESWVCESVPGNLNRDYFVVYEWKHLTGIKGVGAAVVDGRPTWHIVGFAVWKEPKKHLTHYEPVDYYIAQDDHTLVREIDDAATNGPDKLIPYSMVLDYSRYGESVPVVLPKTCRHK
jgi:hypothetical protein